MNKVTISFKNTTRDIKILMYVKSQEEKSQFIKDALEYYIDYLEDDDKE